jgi:hypothetical protein
VTPSFASRWLAPQLLAHDESKQHRLVELWQGSRSNQSGYYVIYPGNRKSFPATDTVIKWAFNELKHTSLGN